MNKIRIYIAGRMRGIPYYNFPAFDKKRDELETAGYKVISPADLDRLVGFDAMKCPPDTDWNQVGPDFDFEDCVTRDIEAVRSCDAIYMLEGWEQSRGARAEHAIAVWLSKMVMYEKEGGIIEGTIH